MAGAVIAVCLFFALSSADVAAQCEDCVVKEDEFKSIKAFSRVNVGPLKGSAENLELQRAELTEHVQNLFRELFTNMELEQGLLPFTADEPRDLGYIRFTVRTVGVDDPLILHVLLRSGNYAKIGEGIASILIYNADSLQLSSPDEINKDVKLVLEAMMRDLSQIFHNAR